MPHIEELKEKQNKASIESKTHRIINLQACPKEKRS